MGGQGSVRGYGEGAVGSGRSCLVANSELTLPLVCYLVILLKKANPHSYALHHSLKMVHLDTVRS